MIVILISIITVVIKFVQHRANALGTIYVCVLETIWRFRLKVSGLLNAEWSQTHTQIPYLHVDSWPLRQAED